MRERESEGEDPILSLSKTSRKTRGGKSDKFYNIRLSLSFVNLCRSSLGEPLVFFCLFCFFSHGVCFCF